MKLLSVVRRQLQAVTVFKAYPFTTFLKQAFLFPYDYYLRDGESTFPLNITLFLTLRCNAKCSMCNLRPLLNQNPGVELTFSEIKDLVTQVAPKKPGFILFGGEPFLRKDILDILALVKDHGMTCGIFTNGLPMKEESIKKMVRLGLDFVAFSLQGPEEIHNRIVGIPIAYDRLRRNVELFLKHRDKTGVLIHSTISADNAGYLEEMVTIAKELGVDAMRFGHPTFFTGGDIRANDRYWSRHFPGEDFRAISWLYTPGEEGREIAERIIALKKRRGDSVSFTPELDDQEVRVWYSDHFVSSRKCVFAWRGLFIYPNGDVCPCESFYYPMGNIREMTLEEIWNSEKYRHFRRQLKKGLFPGCARCCKL